MKTERMKGRSKIKMPKDNIPYILHLLELGTMGNEMCIVEAFKMISQLLRMYRLNGLKS